MFTEQDYAEVAAATGIERVEVLHGHTSMETAFLQPDYPYSWTIRCQRKVWLEKAIKGAKAGEYRLMTQTSNPKEGDHWRNKPKGSTYSAWAVMIRRPVEDKKDFLTWEGFGTWGPGPAEDVRFRVSGIYAQLTDDERKLYDVHLKINKLPTVNSRDWQRWETETVPMLATYYAEHGEFPPLENGIVLGKYMGYERDYQAAQAAVLLAARQ